MVVRSTFDRSYWVIAEIVSISEAKNGHVYLEIAEKENDFLQAKIRANLWSNTKHRLLKEFEHSTKQTLKKGMSVLLNVTLDFHSVYGMSLTILDIDSNFSLGEIERQKQATLLRLESEGLLDFNKQFVLAPVLQSIAIISSETAAGYQDFKKHLEENDLSYRFSTKLFQASMQGDQAAVSIQSAIKAIEESKLNFDVVVLIRGGGSSIDLSCFDDYPLAARLAQCIYPIFTGIGHERDISIADKVAHTNLKTPTAVADYILSHNQKFEEELENKMGNIYTLLANYIDEHKNQLYTLSKSLSFNAQDKMHENAQHLLQLTHRYKHGVNTKLQLADFRLDKFSIILKHDLKIKLQSYDYDLEQHFTRLQRTSKNKITKHREIQYENKKALIRKSQQLLNSNANVLSQKSHLIQMADPIQILKKGFSITRVNGKVISDIKNISKDTIINTELSGGVLTSKVIKKSKNEQETKL